MGTDAERTIRNMIRIGIVSSLNPSKGTALVYFPDKDDDVSQEMPILNRGSFADKDYWMPDVDEQVLCLFLPNPSGRGLNDGYILGTFFSDKDAAHEASADVRCVKFSDGSYVRHDRSNGNLEVFATGNITIMASGNVTIKGATISLN